MRWLFLSEPKKTHLTLLLYLKMSDVIERWLVGSSNLTPQRGTYKTFVAWWVSSASPFIVAITALIEHRCSFVSRPDLFCNRKDIAPTFETSVQRVFKGFLWFFKMPYKMFHLLSSWIRNRMFKNWIHFLLIVLFYFKINMDKTPEKVTKDKHPKPVEAACKGREK